MMNSNDFCHILTDGLSSDQKIRSAAEQRIKTLATSNFGMFLLLCAEELTNESKNAKNRQLAATLIKNMILSMPEFVGKWEQLPVMEKTNVKARVLSTLASQDKDIRKAAALVVASICKIEIPRKEWPDIIEILVTNCSHDNEYFRLSSIITLGYISQEITPKDLSSNEIDKILTGILKNLNSSSNKITSSDLESTSIVALINFISFAKKNFSVPEERKLIMDVIYFNTASPNLEIRVYSMQCLVEITRCYYDFLDDQMAMILEKTITHMEKDDEKVGIQAYELWCSLSDEENARIREKEHGVPNINVYKYSQIASDHLLKMIIYHLMNRKKNEGDEWTLSKAASSLISNLSQCCEYEFITKVVSFVGENLSHTDPKIRDSSILAFTSILETRYKDHIREITMNALDSILNMMNDSNKEVKESTSWCIEKICEFHTNAFLKDANKFDKLYSAILNNLAKGRKIGVHLCNSLHYIAKSIKIEDNKTNILSNYLKDTLGSLLSIALNPDSYDVEHNLALAAFFAIGSLVENSANDTKKIIEDFFSVILGTFQKTIQIGAFSSDQMRNDYQNYLASVIEACMVSEKIKLGFNEGKMVLDMLILSFKQRDGVYEEGLLAASSIALGMNELFTELIKDFGQYLIYALQNPSEVDLCRIAVHSTSDLIRAIGPNFTQYMDQILPLIFNILKDSNSDRTLKIHSFNVISDLFVSNQAATMNYFGEIMDMIGIALNAAVYLPPDMEDIESVEYFDTLREHILECITCVIHALKDMKKTEIFNDYVQGVLNFISNINNDNYNPSFEITRCSVGIIGDLCEIYKGLIKPILDTELLKKLISKLKMQNNSKLRAMVQWAEGVMYEAIK